MTTPEPKLIGAPHEVVESLKSFVSTVIDAFHHGEGWDGYNRCPITPDVAKGLIWHELDKLRAAVPAKVPHTATGYTLRLRVTDVEGRLLQALDDVVSVYGSLLSVQVLGPRRIGMETIPSAQVGFGGDPLPPGMKEVIEATLAGQAAVSKPSKELPVVYVTLWVGTHDGVKDALAAFTKNACTIRDWSLFRGEFATLATSV